ncbi:conserved hypothetical protein [Rippkaea orientalis PCC 8801]|uniref:Uncharacterized protein n=1 Tax=Rippkaea orientalis (strain PCC 8801 / RF-1) TaxID=41431 RepID=B7JWW0_RIPO1|nr:hypothetical protein [Rippkaea orientalis]ACK65809.1 conserved hypothetical protein [Rippkaea orientalis PCC 8801]
MRPQKPIKIDLNNDYPCPCRRRGRLLPIVLTEAFGCDRCQQIFVVEENGQTIEQLSSSYPYKRSWRWTGYRWVVVRQGLGEGYFPLMSGMTIVVLIGWLLLALRSPAGLSMIIWTALIVFLIILSAIIFWLAYRR